MENAYIKLVEASVTQNVTLDEVKDLFMYYKDITSKTGNQLDWNYEEAAFPYTITETKEDYFILKSQDSRYQMIIIGVGTDSEDSEPTNRSYIQVTLPKSSTYGDKGKANEFSKFLGKKLQGELHLFNGRIMYFYKRK
jgi:hypothetical protein